MGLRVEPNSSEGSLRYLNIPNEVGRMQGQIFTYRYHSCMSVCLSVYLSLVFLSVCLSVCLSSDKMLYRGLCKGECCFMAPVL